MLTLLKRAPLASLLHHLKPHTLSSIYHHSSQQSKSERPSLKSKILSLQQLVKWRMDGRLQKLFQSGSSQTFSWGMSSLRLRNMLFIYFKYNYWQKNMYGEQRLIQFCQQLAQQRAKANLNSNSLQNTLMNSSQNSLTSLNSSRQEQCKLDSYQREIVCINLPYFVEQLQFCEHYLQILQRYLLRVDQLGEYEMYFIFDNLERILLGQLIQKEYQNGKDLGWAVISVFDKFVDRIHPRLPTLSAHYKSLLIYLAKTLRSSNLRILQFIKTTLQEEKKEIPMHYFLSGLCILAINRTFPYQYFYKHKAEIMTYLESAEDLSTKKVVNTITMLEIFARIRLMFCEQIVDRVLVCVEQNLTACDITHLTRIFFLYSKLKCSIKQDLVLKIVDRIYLFIDSLDQKSYSFIVKAVSNLNYHDQHLLNTLQSYDYELFLSILKYNVQNSGPFYQQIIEEVQHSFRSDPLRYTPQEDELFSDKQAKQGEGDKAGSSQVVVAEGSNSSH